MSAEDNNLPVETDGIQAIIGTDIYVSGGETAHAQVMKVAWGDSTAVYRATTNTPLPVRVHGLTGDLARITVTGSVAGIGNFNVTNTESSPVYVTGGVRANVYGVTGAPPVNVTGGVYILGNVGISGTVAVTGGRLLNSSTDSVQVTGSVSRNWVLNNVDDNIRIWNHAGGTFIHTKIFGSNGTEIGASGNALNVNIIGAGISANVSIGSSVAVENVTGTVLRVQGTANGTPIPVSISTLPSVSLRTDASLNDLDTPLFVDSKLSSTSSLNLPAGLVNASNIERLLVANNPLDTSSLRTAAQWLSFLWDTVGGKSSSEVGTIQKKLTDAVSSLQNNKVSVNYLTDPFAFFLTFNLPTSSEFAITNFTRQKDFSVITRANGFLYQNKTNVDIYLISKAYMDSINLNDVCGTVGDTPSSPCPLNVRVANSGPTTYVFYITTGTALATNVLNGTYRIPSNGEAILPALYTHGFVLAAPTNPTTSGLLITAV